MYWDILNELLHKDCLQQLKNSNNIGSQQPMSIADMSLLRAIN